MFFNFNRPTFLKDNYQSTPASCRVKIVFDKNPEIYNAGDILSGHVEVKPKSETRVKGIRLHIHGGARVSWDEERSYTKFYSSQVSIKNSEIFIDHTMHLLRKEISEASSTSTRSKESPVLRKSLCFPIYCEPDESPGIILPPGTHKYPFEFTLPRRLPSSYDGKWGHIQYFARVTLERPWKQDYECVALFIVNNVVDFNEDPEMLRPVAGSDTVEVPGCCCDGGSLAVEVKVPRKGFVRGERLTFTVKVTNCSTLGMREAKVALVQHTLFHAITHYTKRVSNTLQSVSGGPIAPGNTRVWDNQSVDVPDDALPTCKESKTIQIKYTLSVIMTPSNTWMSDFTIPINIVVGTVPLTRATISRYLNQLGLSESCVSLATRHPQDRNSRVSMTDTLLTATTRPEDSARIRRRSQTTPSPRPRAFDLKAGSTSSLNSRTEPKVNKTTTTPTTPKGTIIESPFESTDVAATSPKRSPSGDVTRREKRRSGAAQFDVGDDESEEGGIIRRRDAVKRRSRRLMDGEDEEEAANDADDELETEEEDRETVTGDLDDEELTDSEFTLAKDVLSTETLEMIQGDADVDEHLLDADRDVTLQDLAQAARETDSAEIDTVPSNAGWISPESVITPPGDGTLNDESIVPPGVSSPNDEPEVPSDGVSPNGESDTPPVGTSPNRDSVTPPSGSPQNDEPSGGSSPNDKPVVASGDSSLNDDSIENDGSAATVVELTRDASVYEDLSGALEDTNTNNEVEADLIPSPGGEEGKTPTDQQEENTQSPGERSLYDNVDFCDERTPETVSAEQVTNGEAEKQEERTIVEG